MRATNIKSIIRGSEKVFGGLLFALVCYGCASAQVETQVYADADVPSYSTFSLSPPVLLDGVRADDLSEILQAMLAEAERQLVDKGYRLAADPDAELIFLLELRMGKTARRVWSSDPDANAYVTREFDEGTLTLSALEASGRGEIWRGEARSRMPDRELFLGPKAADVWMNALTRVIERFPERTRPTS